MGRKRNRNNLEKRGGSADNPRPGRGGPGENWGDDGGARTAPAPLIAVHPTGDLVAVAFGAIVRVYDLKRDRPARLVSEHPADAHAAPPSSAEAPAASPAAADDDDEAKKISAKKMSSSSDDRDHDPRWHAEAVRALRFDPTGRFMLTAGDDKLARVWRVHHNVAFDERSVPGDPATVACVARATLPKKLSAATFTDDGERAFFADKFGDVFVLPTDKPTLDARRRRREAEGVGERGGNDAAKKKKMNGDAGASGEGEAEDAEEKTQTGRQSLSSDDDVASYALGHCCSIVTDACVPPGSSLLCTADRDNKVRITHVPRGGSSSGGGDVLDVGAPEILSFCRGHASHVACCAIVPGRGDRLVTGGGDGTVRLWRVNDGEELAEVKVAEPYAEKEPDEEEEGGEEGEDNSEKDDDAEAAAAKAAAGGPPSASASGGYKHRDHRAPFAPAVFALAVHGSEVYACVEGEGMRLVARVDGEGADALVATSEVAPAGDERERADADADAPRRVATSLACGGGRLWAVGARNDEDGPSGGDGAGATAVVFEVVGGAEDGIGGCDAAANERCAAALAIRGPRVERVGADADVRKATYDAREREGRKKGRRDKTAFSASARAYEAERKERGG